MPRTPCRRRSREPRPAGRGSGPTTPRRHGCAGSRSTWPPAGCGAPATSSPSWPACRPRPPSRNTRPTGWRSRPACGGCRFATARSWSCTTARTCRWSRSPNSSGCPEPAPRSAPTWTTYRRNLGMREDELRRQIAELVADNADRATPPPIAAIRRRRRRRRARLASGAVLLIAAVAASLVAVQGPLRRQVTVVPVVTQPPRPTPDPRPRQWVYSKELRVEQGVRKPWTHEQWIRVDGRKFISSASNRRVARGSKVRRERMDWPSAQVARFPRCPSRPERIPPAVGLGRFFPNPASVPTDPDGLLTAIYQLVEDPDCAPIPVGDTVQDRA